MIVCLDTEDSDVVQVISTLLLYGTCNEMFCIQQRLQLLTESYLENGEEPFTVDILKEMTSKYLAFVFLKQVVFLIEHCRLCGMAKSVAFSKGKADYVYFTAINKYMY